MDRSRYCKKKSDHRLYRAMGEECPCYQEMVAARKARLAMFRSQSQNTGSGAYGASIAPGITTIIQNIPVQRSTISYVPANRKQ